VIRCAESSHVLGDFRLVEKLPNRTECSDEKQPVTIQVLQKSINFLRKGSSLSLLANFTQASGSHCAFADLGGAVANS